MSKQKLKYIIIALSAVFVILLIFFLYVISKPVPVPVPLGPENMIDISDIETTESFDAEEPGVTIQPENEEYIEVIQFDSFDDYQKWVENEKKQKTKVINKTEENKTEKKSETKKKKESKKKKENSKEKKSNKKKKKKSETNS